MPLYRLYEILSILHNNQLLNDRLKGKLNIFDNELESLLSLLKGSEECFKDDSRLG